MSEPIRDIETAVRELGALPVPAGPDRLTPEQRAKIADQIGDARPATPGLLVAFGESVQNRREHEHPTWEDLYCMNLSSYMGERMAPVLRRLIDSEATAERLRVALESAKRDRRELRARVAELEAERHVTNEALDDAVQALREKGQREAAVTKFVAARAEYITAIRNCHPDNGHDYDRWQGHAAARRQLAELLGLPVAWPAEDAASVAKSADRLTQMLAPTQALRPDDEFGLHHTYRVGRDLPETGGAR